MHWFPVYIIYMRNNGRIPRRNANVSGRGGDKSKNKIIFIHR